MEKLTQNIQFKSLLQAHGYDVMNVTWEDCARTKGSCWGPNISDMTLSCDEKRMPVVRKNNFSDVTVDFPINKFTCAVGNEDEKRFESQGNELKTISLKEYLKNIGTYTDSYLESMYLDRDKKILASTQYCLLPCDEEKTEFNVKLFNYQSSSNSPAVLVIVSSAQGTSCQVVSRTDNTLYFNKFGKNANFLVERLKTDRERRGVATDGDITSEEKQRNVIFVYQVPLKVERKSRGSLEGYFGGGGDLEDGCFLYSMNTSGSLPRSRMFLPSGKHGSRKVLGFDHGMLSTTEGKGVYAGVGTKRLERDPDYPIRVTMQHYKVSDTTDVPSEVTLEMISTLKKVFAKGDSFSSLVVEDTKRVTEPVQIPSKEPELKPVRMYNF